MLLNKYQLSSDKHLYPHQGAQKWKIPTMRDIAIKLTYLLQDSRRTKKRKTRFYMNTPVSLQPYAR